MAAAPTDGLSSEAMAQFMVLQGRYVAGLPLRWLEIRDAPDRQSLRSALHRLSGSAGSYGFEGISQCARAAEALASGEGGAALAQALRVLETEIGRLQEP